MDSDPQDYGDTAVERARAIADLINAVAGTRSKKLRAAGEKALEYMMKQLDPPSKKKAASVLKLVKPEEKNNG
jgi:hypothetical protein